MLPMMFYFGLNIQSILKLSVPRCNLVVAGRFFPAGSVRQESRIDVNAEFA
jgi:hypothetical protein